LPLRALPSIEDREQAWRVAAAQISEVEFVMGWIPFFRLPKRTGNEPVWFVWIVRACTVGFAIIFLLHVLRLMGLI
jgi:hypothetical protein